MIQSFAMLACSIVGLISASDEEVAAPHSSRFEAEVLPILQTHCLKCHGGEKVRAGLDLSSLKGLLAGENRGRRQSSSATRTRAP